MPTSAIAIDGEVTIVAPCSDLGHTMLHMVRHPDGSIYVNTHALGLLRGTDDGQTWTQVPLNLPDAPPGQDSGGFGVTRDGRLWVVHQSCGTELFVSHSADGGRIWKTTSIDYAQLAPGAPEDPYVMAAASGGYVNFIERPDGTLMFSLSLRYEDWQDYAQADQSRPGMRGVMIRSADGGESWGDPMIVRQHTTETGYAVDPENPDHILAMTRIQRFLLPGEDLAAVEEMTGCAPGAEYVYKNGVLLESTDAGRSFREVPGSMTRYYEHRGTILWTERNVVVVTHQGGVPRNAESDHRLLARISLDGGRTWADGAGAGTPSMDQSEKFVLVPNPPGHFFTAPTVELSANRFLTAYAYGIDPQREYHQTQVGVNGLFWRLESSA